MSWALRPTVVFLFIDWLDIAGIVTSIEAGIGCC